jgi:hypothetical protein
MCHTIIQNSLKHDIFMNLEFHFSANFNVGHIRLSSCSLIVSEFIESRSNFFPNEGLAMGSIVGMPNLQHIGVLLNKGVD